MRFDEVWRFQILRHTHMNQPSTYKSEFVLAKKSKSNTLHFAWTNQLSMITLLGFQIIVGHIPIVQAYILIPVPVVPHKAVAEVSKIGNL
jgi:hypothetical protein